MNQCVDCKLMLLAVTVLLQDKYFLNFKSKSFRKDFFSQTISSATTFQENTKYKYQNIKNTIRLIPTFHI